MKKCFCLAAFIVLLLSIYDSARAQISVNSDKEIKQLENTLNAMSKSEKNFQDQAGGSDGIEKSDDILNKAWDGVYQDKPKNDQSVDNTSESNSSSSDSSKNPISELKSLGSDQALKFIKDEKQQKGAIDRANMESFLKDAKNDLGNIKALNAAISDTSSPKDIADLQARIATENAVLQQKIGMINAIISQQKSEDSIINTQQEYVSRKYAIGDDDDQIVFPKIEE